MKLKRDYDVSTADFWYDLTDGGYIRPHEICEDTKDAEEVMKAVRKIKEFQNCCEDQIEGFIQ